MTETPALKLNIPRTILVGLAFFTVSIFWQAYDTLMPLYLTDFGLSYSEYSIVMIMDNILALVLLPFMGILSDRFPMKWRKKFGRRIPFIVCGSVLAAVTFMLLNLGHSRHNFALMITMTAFVLVFMCLYRTPAVALMPDVTPKPIRSPANAVINIMGLAGGLIFLILSMFLRDVADNWILFSIVVLLMIASSVVMAIKVDENKMAEEKAELLRRLGIDEDENDEVKEKISTRAVLRSLSRGQLVSLFMILISVFLWYMAYNSLTTHFSVFSQQILGMDFELPLMVAQVSAACMFVPSAFLGKKIGRKRTVLLGVLLMVAGLAFGTALIFATSSAGVIKAAMYPVFIFVGAGWATINVHSFVMSVELATEQTTGAYTGLYYAFAMGAQATTPFFAGLCMDYIDPRALLPYALIFAALAFFTMLFVRHGNVRPAAGAGGETGMPQPDSAAGNPAKAEPSAAE